MTRGPAVSKPGVTVVPAEGVPIRLARLGHGRPVVLIHGASGNLNDMTFRLGPELAQRHAVIAPDRPGHGRSGLPADGPATLGRQAALLRAAVAAVGVARPIVVGHSYGGAVALAWALDAPETLAGVVLVGAPSQVWPGRVGRINDALASRLVGPPLARLLPRLVTRALAERALAGVFAPQRPPAGYLDHLDLALVLQPATLRENARQLTALKAELAARVPDYPRLAVPVALVHGDADPTVGFERHAQAFAAQVPAARAVWLPGIGHMPHQVATAEVAAVVDAMAQAAG